MTAGQVSAELLSAKRVGDFHHLTFLAAGLAERFRPGTVVAIAVGGPLSDRLARRTFPIHRARSSAYGGTIEVAFEAREAGERWLAAAPAHTRLDLVGPLGRPFALPRTAVPCVLVGHEVAAAQLQPLAERLRERFCDVHVILSARTAGRAWGALEARRVARSVAVVTEDGPAGESRGGSIDGPVGAVLTVLPELLRRTRAGVVYAAGPDPLLHAVAEAAESHGAWSQLAVGRSLPCATGSCRACLLPVVGADGVARQARVCAEGPVFRGDRISWSSVRAGAGG